MSPDFAAVIEAAHVRDPQRVPRAMLDEALAGPARTFRTEGADGIALRSVGTIASKLA